MRWTLYGPALLGGLLVVSATPALAVNWVFDDEWDDWDDDDWWDDDLFDDDDSIFGDRFDGFGHRNRFHFDFDSDLSSLLLAGALDDGCLDIKTLVLLDAVDDGRISQRDLRELALVRHLVESGVVNDACVT